MARDLSCNSHPQYCKFYYKTLKLIGCSTTRSEKPTFNFNVLAEDQVVTCSTSY